MVKMLAWLDLGLCVNNTRENPEDGGGDGNSWAVQKVVVISILDLMVCEREILIHSIDMG